MFRSAKKRRARLAPGKRKITRPSSSPFSDRLIRLSFVCFFLFILGAIASVLLGPKRIIDESNLVEKRRLVFEEPNPPMREPTEPPTPVNKGGLPLVAIIIDDMGYHEKIGGDLMALPMQLTFSFLPYAPFTRQQEAAAAALGHTVLLHLPMQPENKMWNPGPGALYLGEKENAQKKILDLDLSWVPHAVGVNNHMGSLITQDEQSMRFLLHLLEEKRLFFIDSLTTPKSVAYRLAMKMGVKTGRRQIFLDNVHTEDQISQQLDKLVMEAQNRGKVIGIGHPYPETLRVLATRLSSLNEKVHLVGVEKVIQ